ncbi:tetratricopeptide repeat protein [Hymenobacter sedentarius]|uniref:tetratricopeptide repeat protein n=1 Tax=Hymenobacter sedentarius TaxID=1411621 RepID=UPI0012FD9BAE|nr:tetratricopeptide repeat protein [Hymenobacter sedentarius]
MSHNQRIKILSENYLSSQKKNEPKPSAEEVLQYQRGYSLWYNGDSQAAIASFRKFISKYPKSSLADDAQRMIGTSYGNLKAYTNAIEEYKRVKANYPDANSTPLALYDLAHLYFFSLNDFGQARYFYEEFINSATEDDIKIRNIALEQIENWDEQTKYFKGSAKRWKEYEKTAQAYNPTDYLKVKSQSWEKGGFGAVGIHNLTIENKSNISFKDVIIRVDYYSETDALLARNLRTIYRFFPAKQTVKVDELNTGFIPADAKKSVVEIVTALAGK